MQAVPGTTGLNALAVAPGGSLLASLAGTTFGAQRYLASGALDRTFFQSGTSLLPIGTIGAGAAQGNAIAVGRDGSIVLGGVAFPAGDASTSGQIALAKLGATGHPDTAFGTGGSMTIFFQTGASAINGVAVDSVGRTVVAANIPTPALPASLWSIARFTSIGALDTSFGNGVVTTNVGCGAGGDATAVAIQPDGRVLVAGPDHCALCSKGTPTQDCNGNYLILARYWP